MSKTIKTWIKVVLFAAGITGIVIAMTHFFRITNTFENYKAWDGFYEEAQDELDGVYIGASNVYAFWSSATAWEEYGYPIYALSTPSLPARAVKYYIEEARKTQPNALYIVNLNDFKDTDIEVRHAHYAVDFMKLSTTKINLINALTPYIEEDYDSLEFYLPFIRFHSRWTSLDTEDFNLGYTQLMGTALYYGIDDVSDEYTDTDATVALAEEQSSVLEDLLSYVKEEKVNILFVVVPQALKNESNVAELNATAEIVANAGYDVLNLQSAECMDEMGLDLTEDYYDKHHVNAHGAIKYTRYLAEYLQENYQLADHRGEAAYAEWDENTDKFIEEADSYVLDFEIEGEARDFSLEATKITTEANGVKVDVSWDPVEKATGYVVYRKKAGDTWQRIYEAGADETSYTDKGELKDFTKYYYTVVPTRTEDGITYYGNYPYEGEKTTTSMAAPSLLSLEETEEGVTITWDDVKGADGYAIFRKINGQSWVRIARVNDETYSYTDSNYEQNLTYRYSVSAYVMDGSDYSYGDYSSVGLLLDKGLATPQVSATASAEGISLTWDAVKGASLYTLYRKGTDGEWEVLADNLDAEDITYTDTSLTESGSYCYRLAAVIKYDGNRTEYPSDEILAEWEVQ